MTKVQEIFGEKIIENIEEYQSRISYPVTLQNFGGKIFLKIVYSEHTSMRKFIFPKEGGLVVNIQHVSEPNKLVTAKTRVFTEEYLEETLDKNIMWHFMNSVSSESLFVEGAVNIEKLLEVKEWLYKTSRRLGTSVNGILNFEFEL